MDDLRQKYETFTDCWNACKELHPVQVLDDDAYWQRVIGGWDEKF